VERQVLQILRACVRACVCLALVIQHDMGMRHIVIFGQSGSTKLFHITPLTTRLSGEKLLDKKNACFEFTYNFCPQHFSR
jgi:hypothetical protein